MFLLGFYRRMLALHLRSLSVTPGQLWLVVLSVAIDIMVSILLIESLFLQTASIAGWSRDQVLFLYGYWYLGFALYHTFMNAVQDVPRYLITGGLDTILLKPINNLVYLTSTKLSPYGVPGMIAGVIICLVSAPGSGLRWGPLNVVLFVVFLLGANGINYGLQLLIASLSFYLGPSNNAFMVFWDLLTLGSFPLSIFSRPTQGLLAVITVAFISFFPVSYLLGKPGSVWGLLTPVVGAACVLAGRSLWEHGLERYQSAGGFGGLGG